MTKAGIIKIRTTVILLAVVMQVNQMEVRRDNLQGEITASTRSTINSRNICCAIFYAVRNRKRDLRFQIGRRGHAGLCFMPSLREFFDHLFVGVIHSLDLSRFHRNDFVSVPASLSAFSISNCSNPSATKIHTFFPSSVQEPFQPATPVCGVPSKLVALKLACSQ